MIKFLTGDEIFRAAGGHGNCGRQPIGDLANGVRTPRREVINSEEPPEVFHALPNRRLHRVARQGGSLGDQPSCLNSGQRGSGCQPPTARRPAAHARWQEGKLTHATQICEEAARLSVLQLAWPYCECAHQAGRPFHRLLDQRVRLVPERGFGDDRVQQRGDAAGVRLVQPGQRGRSRRGHRHQSESHPGDHECCAARLADDEFDERGRVEVGVVTEDVLATGVVQPGPEHRRAIGSVYLPAR